MQQTGWSRRQVLAAATVSAAAAGTAAALWPPRGGPRRERPNVLFISIDDLNDWVGVLGGHPQVQTPNLDALARRGMLFTNAHSPGVTCNPSRTAVLTGVRPSTSGVYRNAYDFRRNPLLQHAVTLPQRFMAEGYRTTGAGKIFHHGKPDSVSWQSYWPSLATQMVDDYRPQEAPHLPGASDPDVRTTWGPYGTNADMSDWRVASHIIEQLRQYALVPPNRPFFLGCGFYRPHQHWYVPQSYFDLYPEDVHVPTADQAAVDKLPQAAKTVLEQFEESSELRRGLLSDPVIMRSGVRAYLAAISFVDACVGRVVDALSEFQRFSPWLANTMIVLWSDHGYHLGEKRFWGKRTLWEESTRVPLMIAGPGIAPARCEAPVNLIDIYPTLLKLCDLPSKTAGPDQTLEGHSLLPLIRDPNAPWPHLSVTTRGFEEHAVRSRDWRYIRYRDGSEELYDHRNDPGERENLADVGRYESIKRELQAGLPVENFKRKRLSDDA